MKRFPKPFACAERQQRLEEQTDLENMVGEDLDAIDDQQLMQILKKHNVFAYRRFETGGRSAVPRITLLRAVYQST